MAASHSTARRSAGDETVGRALKIIEGRMKKSGALFRDSGAAMEYARVWLGDRDRECFGVLFLDVQNRLIAAEELFRGTLDQTTVYPREIVRRAMALNCRSVILAHNHPSGSPEPSDADIHLTTAIQLALHLVDCGVLDHVVVGGAECKSMAALGLMGGGRPGAGVAPAAHVAEGGESVDTKNLAMEAREAADFSVFCLDDLRGLFNAIMSLSLEGSDIHYLARAGSNLGCEWNIQAGEIQDRVHAACQKVQGPVPGVERAPASASAA